MNFDLFMQCRENLFFSVLPNCSLPFLVYLTFCAYEYVNEITQTFSFRNLIRFLAPVFDIIFSLLVLFENGLQ